MKLATVLLNNTPTVIARVGDEMPRKLPYGSMIEAIGAGRAELETARLRGEVVDELSLRFLPVIQPGKIIAIGLNYMDHVREQGIKAPEKPLIFAKLTSSVTAHEAVIEWDPSIAQEVDYEAELAVIFARPTRLVTAESALNYVFGYTCVNDVTARDLQRGDGQWTRAKGMDTFCPLGPWIVTADEIPDPQNLAIRTTVDGTVLQDSSTREMIFDVKTLIAYVSQTITLNPGDVMMTGTPDGVGVFRTPKTLLRDGQTVTVEVEKVGTLRNVCRELTFTAR